MLILTTGKFASYLEETKRRIQGMKGGELFGQQKAGCSFCFMKGPAQANPVLSNGDRKPARRLSLVWLPLQIAEGTCQVDGLSLLPLQKHCSIHLYLRHDQSTPRLGS